MVLDSFPRFYTKCRISIELVVWKGIHWERVGHARREKNGATAYFYVSIATENVLLRQRFPRLCRDSGFHVTIGPARVGHFRVAT